MKKQYLHEEPIPHVIVDGEMIPMDDVEFIDISEDISGRDLIKFKYNNEVRESFVTMLLNE